MTERIVSHYVLSSFVAEGGMATIWKAYKKDDPQKVPVILKIPKSHFQNDRSIQEMLAQEIEITAQLKHPNIVEVIDYQCNEKITFMAMEYLNGHNLKNIFDTVLGTNLSFPLELALFIAHEVSSGLYYAHTKLHDKTGLHLHLIHRDISPHNIMTSIDGQVKVIDFGVAKSKMASEKTKTGFFKGKLPYMAPEYLKTNNLDPRYDQFSLAIILWELLTSRRLFSGENEVEVLRQVEKCKIRPPSDFNPKVTPELDRIVLKSLSRNPLHRFEHMGHFQNALKTQINHLCPDVGNEHLRAFLNIVCPTESDEFCSPIITEPENASSLSNRWVLNQTVGEITKVYSKDSHPLLMPLFKRS